MDYNKLLGIPKTELHCHLDGSLTLSCMRELLHRDISYDEIKVSEDCLNLEEYLSKFKIPLECLQTKESLKRGAFDFIKEVSKENVQYVEVRFAPMLSTNENLSTFDVIESVLDGLKEGEKVYGVKSNIIASLMRHHSKDTNLRMIEIAKDYLGNGLCAIDLAGNEAAYPMKYFLDIFSYANTLGIPYTIHAGECGNSINVLDSINIGTKRIGHGIALKNNLNILNFTKNKNIGIEMCPSSNFQTKAVAMKEDYPIKYFLQKDLLVTINTDNRTVSDTSLTKELLLLQNSFDISDYEIYKLLFNSIKVSFANENLKQKLMQNLANFY